ncbi:GNAT family N-acetyltransferase [Campylobacter coli]|nr:GNAT family N-acetyltransferase [Campylobacter coli]EIA97745.1 putative acetyltransferase [Campylobacter coli LMG 23341]EIA99127.1 putative acetyltransferase [Campylobacter coli LMG 23342]EIE1435843.1 GNAT family N-acetyltransferase [Campylobacter coli]EKT1033250.1 GNAT family N-acetyltransferase [Campylobacter coli]
MREINLKEDLEKIYPLIKQLRNNLSLEDFLEKFQLAKKTQHYKLFAYEDKGAFKAACGVMPFNVLYHNHCLYICDFVVDETLRGKGIGQAFLKKIQIWAKNQGYEELELSSSFFLEHKLMNFISKKWVLKNLVLFLRKISNYNIF